MGSMKSAQVQVKDHFKPLPEYCIDPLEVTAIGLKLGQLKFEKCIAEAKKRGIREFAVIGNAGIRVHLRPPADLRPPEPWLHEFVKPKYLQQAKEICTDEA